ncbi:MAG: mechanosensitive ion channel [Phormidium sp. SL48-SHIP]|nr:MAG: mechanosensitive ion channel [Phormidium sp. SL48-SHIP]
MAQTDESPRPLSDIGNDFSDTPPEVVVPETLSPRPTFDPETESARVIVDGIYLFEMADTAQFPAEERAALMNDKLQQAAESPGLERIEVVMRNDLPTLLIDGAHLITVTKSDASLGAGVNPREQAERWAEQIRQVLRQANQERSDTFLRRAILQVILVVSLACVLHWGIHRLSLYFCGVHSDSRILEAWRGLVVWLGRIILWSVTIFYVSDLFPTTRQWSYRLRQIITNSITAPILPLDANTYSLVDILVLIAFLLALVVGANRLSQLLRVRVLAVSRLNRSAQDAIATAIKYTLMVMGTVVIFNLWGLDISSLTILAGALSVGIGFGLQDIAKNLGSGLVLLFERPIQVGDFVEVGDSMGTVERIGSRSTLIRTLDRVSIIVPNSRFLESEVINWSHDNPVSRLRLPVGVAYGSNLEDVKEALLEAAQDHPQVLRIPPPRILFKGFGDSSLDFQLLVWCGDPSQQQILSSDLYFGIYEQLQRRAIEIPFPQRDLHLRSGSFLTQRDTQNGTINHES